SLPEHSDFLAPGFDQPLLLGGSGHLLIASVGAAPLNAAQPLPPAASVPAEQAVSRVAAGQWPYDGGLLKLILRAEATRPGVLRSAVGVMDVGLMDANGGPLPRDTFAAP